MSPTDFLAAFKFRPDLADYVGIEIEGFLRDQETGLVVPRAAEFLDGMRLTTWGYELSAAQVEFRTRPLASFGQIKDELDDCFREGDRRANELGLAISYDEVGSADMPLEVYPHVSRYRAIAERLSEAQLRAACRVAGIHMHWGIRDWTHAIQVYSRLRKHLPKLIAMGDGSGGERLRLYHEVAARRDPPELQSPMDLIREATAGGFLGNPRDCWWLLRVSTYGTVEVRVFGTTRDVSKIMSWVRTISEIANPGTHW